MITKTARRLLSVNKNALRFGFCLNKALLDPYKHTTMNHSPHNMFVDLYDFGEYPEIILPASIPARTYQPVVVSTAVDVLNKQYGTNLTVEDFNNNLQKPWTRFIIKNLNSKASVNDVLTPILNKLSLNLFVKESRWTWVVEQTKRLQASASFFQRNNPETLGDFLDSYNALIEKLVLQSTFGHSPHIPQALTALDKHYVQEMHKKIQEGVEELNNLQGDKNNLINKLMGLIHRY